MAQRPGSGGGNLAHDHGLLQVTEVLKESVEVTVMRGEEADGPARVRMSRTAPAKSSTRSETLATSTSSSPPCEDSGVASIWGRNGGED